jgi:hypothetical protein
MNTESMKGTQLQMQHFWSPEWKAFFHSNIQSLMTVTWHSHFTGDVIPLCLASADMDKYLYYYLQPIQWVSGPFPLDKVAGA